VISIFMFPALLLKKDWRLGTKFRNGEESGDPGLAVTLVHRVTGQRLRSELACVAFPEYLSDSNLLSVHLCLLF